METNKKMFLSPMWKKVHGDLKTIKFENNIERFFVYIGTYITILFLEFIILFVFIFMINGILMTTNLLTPTLMINNTEVFGFTKVMWLTFVFSIITWVMSLIMFEIIIPIFSWFLTKKS